ncbi:hypothetical protein Mlute_02195 [Meiothermus luteus]|uniref:Outer membrane protein beta-barrel domain protein n=1 Tax=Meiothermus luteus TaxID=2026184 RepID=A0A399EJI4_9DEIN|nr:hypothetical protein [Meiothermus luteus]RIH83460.1 hypothetical protein Mlute_02195 [Meiothermus luteus]RMH56420.1 MAG: hypothetical protein D6684_05540 [Deinococcota bacterium]
MKKLFALLAVALLSGALAQGRLFGEVASGNLSMVPSFGLSVSARMGAEELLGPLALRGGFGLGVSGSSTNFNLGAGVLYFLRGSSLPFYFGGGLGLQAGGATAFNLNGAAGLELPVTRDFNFFLELQPSIRFVSGSSQFTLGLEFGPRLYFR